MGEKLEMLKGLFPELNLKTKKSCFYCLNSEVLLNISLGSSILQTKVSYKVSVNSPSFQACQKTFQLCFLDFIKIFGTALIESCQCSVLYMGYRQCRSTAIELVGLRVLLQTRASEERVLGSPTTELTYYLLASMRCDCNF